MQKKRQTRIIGDIVRIDLGDGFHSYARVLEEALFAFYDCRVTKELAVEEIISHPVLFQVPVMDKAVKQGRWAVVGSVPPQSVPVDPLPRFMQDPLNRDRFSIYEKGRARPAEKHECIGLEREAVWDPAHVEDRLRDFYAGKPNKWVESLKIRE